MKPVHAVPLNEIPKQCSAKHRLSQKENGIGTISHQFICVNLVKSWDLKNCNKNGTMFNYISQLILIVTAAMLIFRTPHSTAIQRQFMWKLSSLIPRNGWPKPLAGGHMNNNCRIWGNKCCFDHLFSFFCSSSPAQKSVRVWACRLHPWEKAAGCTILCFKINQSNMWASQVVRGSKRMWNSSLRYVWSDSFQSIAYNNSLSIWETLQEFIWNFVRNRYLSLIFSYLFLFCRLR